MKKLEDREFSIFLENIRYLFDTLPHGGRKKVAQQIGVHELTLSRWYAGSQHITSTHLKKIVEIFAIPSDIDLQVTRLSEVSCPITDRQRRKWLCQQIEPMNNVMLDKLFPALEILLKVER